MASRDSFGAGRPGARRIAFTLLLAAGVISVRSPAAAQEGPDPNWIYRIPSGGQFSGATSGTRCDDDLEFIVFASSADILGIGTPPNVSQVYRWERSTNATILVSRTAAGQPAPQGCYRPTISDGGKRIAFDTLSGLVPQDTNGVYDVYMRIFDEGNDPITVRASVGATGQQGNSWSAYACVSGSDALDESYVAFTSAATNLVPADANGSRTDVFRAHLTGWSSPPPHVDQVLLVSVNNSGAQSLVTDFTTSHTGANRMTRCIDRYGDFIAFVGAPCDWTDPCVNQGSFLNCLCPDPDGECVVDCAGVKQVYVRSLWPNNTRTWRLSRAYIPGQGYFPGSGDSRMASIAEASGSLIAFASTATNFPGDTDMWEDVFAFKVGPSLAGIDGTVENPDRMSRPLGGAASNGHSNYPAAVQVTGYHVSFESTATNLVAGDTNAQKDVFVADNATHTVRRFSVASAGGQANGTSSHGDLVLSTAEHGGDGGDLAVVLFSTAPNLVPGDTNGALDVFVSLSRRFVRGDSNDDGVTEQTDRDFAIAYLFLGGDAPNCLVAADRNDDGVINLSDTVICPSCPPGLEETCCLPAPSVCGVQFTPDALPCELQLSCQ